MLELDDLIWVELEDDDSFLKVKETLTRIGVASRDGKRLFQSCHILHKRGRYAIVHFKELFMLDGKEANFSEEDKARRNKIANLLAEWKTLGVRLTNPEKTESPLASMSQIKIIPYDEKEDWELVPKYSIGRKR